jgi:hypothetical protein
MTAAASVKRHKLDPEDHRRFFEETIQGMLETLAKSPNVTLSELAALGQEGERVLEYVSVFERENPIQRVAARSLAQGKTGLLLLSNSPPGHTIEVPVGEHRAPFTSYGPESRSHATAWHRAWYGALMSRDEPSLAALAAISDDVLRASTPGMDEFVYAGKAALIAVRENPSAALPYIERAVALTAEDQIQVSQKKGAAREGAVYAMLAPLSTGHPAEFQTALVAALDAHKKFWGTKAKSQYLEGWLAWGPLALCCLARDQGVAVNVESEYLLPYLIERRWQATDP